MNFEPFLHAAPAIQIHAAAALVAVGLGPLALYRKRRDRAHKIVGYTWMGAMTVAALSSFFIHAFAVIGPFSPIHFLSVFALWSVWTALRAAIEGDLARHASTLRSLYWRGLLVAGLFTFMPGRIANRIVLSDEPWLGWGVIGLGAALLLAGARHPVGAAISRRENA